MSGGDTFEAEKPRRVDAQPGLSKDTGIRALTIYGALASIATRDVGAVVECGVATGETAAGMCQILGALGQPHWVHLFDTFGEIPIDGRNSMAADAVGRLARSTKDVHDVLLYEPKADPGDETARRRYAPKYLFHPGLFSTTLPSFHEQIIFLHADGDLYESTLSIIELANRCVVTGGIVVFDDYGTEWTGVTKSVDEHLGKDWMTYKVRGVGQLVAVRR